MQLHFGGADGGDKLQMKKTPDHSGRKREVKAERQGTDTGADVDDIVSSSGCVLVHPGRSLSWY